MLVDEGRIAMSPAVELSYLSKDEQAIVYEQIMECDCTPSHAQTRRFRQFSKEGRLSDEVIESIMREEKPNQKEKLHIPYDQIRAYLPRDTIIPADMRLHQACTGVLSEAPSIRVRDVKLR